MIKLNLFTLAGLLITFTYLPIVIFLFLKGRTKLTKVYASHLTTVLWWGICATIIPFIHSKEQSYLVWKISHVGVFLISPFFLHAVYILAQKNNSRFIVYAYGQAIFFALITLTGHTFVDIRLIFGEYYWVKGNYLYYMASFNWALLAILAYQTLIKYYKYNFPYEKQLIKLLFISTLGYIGGATNFLIIAGLDLYPLGNLFIPIHSLVITYAILRHQFLNIELVYKKGLLYSILLIIVLLFYTLTVLIFERYMQTVFNYKSLTISLLIAFTIGLLFIPVRNKIQSLIDKLFHTRSPEEIEKENELLKQEIIQTDRLKSIATFASGMAHEIKNPLTSIKVFCEYLPEKIHDKKFLETFIPLINKDADRINELVHDLLEYAKPSPPQLINTDIHKVIESVLDALSSRIINRKIQVIKDFHPNTPLIPLDSKQIKQALLNIILNSLEAMPEQGTLKLTTQLSAHQDKLLINITDNGSGISPEDLPRVFDPFFSKKDKGTGLGLSITHGIIKEHGGKIFVESDFKNGTEFRIELMIAKNRS